MDVNALLKQLAQRLPELEWQLNKLYSFVNVNTLPKGLFRECFEYTPQSCIEDIKEDVRLLSHATSSQSLHFLVHRVHQKINVLVRLCQYKSTQKARPRATSFGVRALSTRQQWLQNLDEDIDRLRAQYHAVTIRQENHKHDQTSQVVLNLEVERGDIQRQLTLLEEARSRAQIL